MLTNTYNRYLTSPKWKAKRWAIAYSRGFVCEKCGRYCKDNFEVHHKTYKRIFHEPSCDLMLLCGDCHRLVEIQKRIRRKQGDKVIRRKSIRYKKNGGKSLQVQRKT